MMDLRRKRICETCGTVITKEDSHFNISYKWKEDINGTRNMSVCNYCVPCGKKEGYKIPEPKRRWRDGE